MTGRQLHDLVFGPYEVAHRGGVRSCTSTTPRDSRQVNATGTNPEALIRRSPGAWARTSVAEHRDRYNANHPVTELCRRHGFSEARDDLWRNTFGGRDHEPFRGATFFRLNRVVYLADDDGRPLGRGRKWPARKAGAEPQPDVHPGEPDPAGADEALAGEKHGPASRTRVRSGAC